MLARLRCTVLLSAALALVSFDSYAMAATDDKCCDFVRASIGFQLELAHKIKDINGRPVYLFDATGFSAGFQDNATPLNVRYKTGDLNGTLVDAVLSVSAQTTVGGETGAQTFYSWAGRAPGLLVDDYGVRI